jgi:transcriptional regulator with XRE-family HTH domain
MDTIAKSELDKFIGSRIRENRMSLQLTQVLLAKALGVSFQQVQSYENGTNGISAVRLFDVCRIFNVPLADMFPPVHPKRPNRSHRHTDTLGSMSA